ncbi:MAG: endonuclease III [Candidatus Peribacter sp.]|jgi:endonuclease III|nr:endonuclease III [Candidatus Peribacter sp.]MBT4393304.1 endonuclease III [Candidatus Peribacter sp.]MBT4601199.1 endonuclease III [Candidatus Peribacter sp.]MBT5148841.1 endonuclease III [Candidatus Peribacter sp.]MBT5637279.1 endonuclease III [Candidatus Peribacter sp.]
MSQEPITTVSIVSKLSKRYPAAECTLDWNTPLELLVSTMLAAQCTDKRVNQVGKTLYQKYKCPEDFLKVSQEELEVDIHSCGSFRVKARAIQETCTTIINDFDGEVPRTMKQMLTLRGVGRKTAAVVLHTAFGVVEGIPIDTHNIRLLNRLGLADSQNQDKIELQMMETTPKKDWPKLSHLLVAHGRAVCSARNRDCPNCPFQENCPSSQTQGKTDLWKGKKTSKVRKITTR